MMLAVAVAMTACSKKEVLVEAEGKPTPNLLQYIQNNFTFSCFHAALKKTGLDKTLAERDSLTVLVPDNDAFKKIGIQTPADIERLNTDSLKKALEYHILPQRILHQEIPLALDNEYTNLPGNILYFSRELPRQYPDINNKGHVNGATFKYVNSITKNGVIHVLDKPLKPAAASVQAFLDADTTFSYFVTALKKFGLYNQLDDDDPVTVLALPNSAFRNLNITLDSIAKLDTIQYKKYLFGVHILKPSRLFFSHFKDAPGTKEFDNGPGDYVFSIDGVLYFQYGTAKVYGYGKDYGLPYNIILGPGWSGSATFTSQDIVAVNGVIHVMDRLIIYPNDMKKK